MDDDTTRISTEKKTTASDPAAGAPATAVPAAGVPAADSSSGATAAPAVGPSYEPTYDTAGSTPPPFGDFGSTGSTYGAIPGPWPHDPAGFGPAVAGTGTATATALKRGYFRRSRDDRMLAGVCGGLGRALDVDAALIRVGLVLLTVFGVGAGAIAYLAAWILVPEED